MDQHVAHVGDIRRIAGVTHAGVARTVDPEAGSQTGREIEPLKGRRAMQENDRISLADDLDHGFNAVDVEYQCFEFQLRHVSPPLTGNPPLLAMLRKNGARIRPAITQGAPISNSGFLLSAPQVPSSELLRP